MNFVTADTTISSLLSTFTTFEQTPVIIVHFEQPITEISVLSHKTGKKKANQRELKLR